MRKREWWRLAVLNVLSAPVRSVLTVLGMAIGIAAVLAVLTLGNAGQKQVRSEMKRLGIDRIWISSEENALKRGAGCNAAEALSLKATEQVYLKVAVSTANRQSEAIVTGCTEEYLRQLDAKLLKGRMLYPLEWSGEGNSVLIGRTLAEKLNLNIGDWLYLHNRAFSVCGILDSNETFSQIEISDGVFVPIDALLKYTNQHISEIVMEISEGDNLGQTADRVYQLMKNEADAVTVTTMQLQMDAANSVVSTFVNVLKWVAMICVMVAGIGIMNILLVGVRERRREIGVMQSLGAKGGDICRLFLIEAFMYALAGGSAGILIGWILVEVAGGSIGLTPVISIHDCISVIFAAFATGLGFGTAPAVKAAHMKPADALRSE